MSRIDRFDDGSLEAIASVLADTDSGLTGSEIGAILASCGIEDPTPQATKRHRLHAALAHRQQRDGVGNAVITFIHNAMNPVRYTADPQGFESRRQDLNRALGFSGLFLQEDGRMARATRTRTLTEAQLRTSRVRSEMNRREAHAEVLRYCREELLADDCFDAVFEAIKGLGERIRHMSGVDGDGASLVEQAFALGRSGMPMLAFNSLRTESERSEQKGMMNLMVGVFGAFRNPAAHAPKVTWRVTEPDAVDLLSTLSLIHRRLDSAVRTGAQQATIA